MKTHWKNVSIKKISEESGYGTATVDRVLNNRKGVSKKAKDKILKILTNLQNGKGKNDKKNILVCCQSGPSYNKTLEHSLDTINNNIYKFNLIKNFIPAKDFKPIQFIKILKESSKFDGVIIVSQEDQNINNELSKIVSEDKPVITLTTDLPNSNRTSYIGNNQSNAGSTAAHIIGKVDIDNEGISGIEKSFNAVLKSESKKKIETSLDVRLQHIVRDEILSGMDLYSATGGSGLIIDVNSGEILLSFIN